MIMAVPTCPDCPGSPAAVGIVFGFPSGELFEAADRGEVLLGGCEAPSGGELPQWACPQCKQTLG